MSSPKASSNAQSAAKSLSPLITMGATWGARKAMVKGYEASTGKPAPLVSSKDAGLLQKIIWAAALAAVVALVQSVVWHVIDRDG